MVLKQNTLKGKNNPALIVFMIFNFSLLVVAIKTNQLFIGLDTFKYWKDIAPIGLGLILVVVVTGLFTSNAKARLVFWRWLHPLPGSEAFSRHAPSDPRIDMDVLEQKFGPLPTSASHQNNLWYKLYKSVSDDPTVLDVHRNFLFTRDLTAISVLALVFLGCTGVFLIPSYGTMFAYLGFLIAQYLVIRQAACNYGVRFVTTVLAVKAVE